MKHKGCTSYLIEDRNENLLRAYNKIVRRSGFSALSDIYNELKQTPSPRFWITGERAYDSLVCRRKNPKSWSFDERNAMYDEIESRAQQYMIEHNTTFRKACKAVVMQPAPRFYLEIGTMENIIRMMMTRKRGANDFLRSVGAQASKLGVPLTAYREEIDKG